MSQFSINPVGGYAFATAVAVVMLVLLWRVGPSPTRTTPRRRLLLLGVRALIIALLLAAILRPARVITEVRRETATLVFLADSSRSMLVTDAFGGKSRWESLGNLLTAGVSQLEELADAVQVKIYTFDDDIHRIEFGGETSAAGVDLAPIPDGEQTAIGWALEEVLRREAGGRLAGIVLLSDGAQRALAPRDTPALLAARRLADLGCPLYAMTFGQARGLGQARDLAMKDLITNQTVYVKNQLDISGTLRIDGYAGKPITVQLLFEGPSGKMEVVAATKVTATKDGQQLPIKLSHVPALPGEFKLTLTAVAQEGELVTTNNQLSSFVTVLKGGIRVLYLAGQLRREQKFLRGALDASPNVKVDFWLDRQPRSKWPLDIADRFQPGKYDVIIIGDLDSAAIRTDDWQALADRVDAGAGLMMLGGFHSFGPGGYAKTPLADVLPITMGRLERQRFDEPISEDLHLSGPLKIQPTSPTGVKHPTMQLAPGSENLQVWSELPALDGANRFAGLKAGASVLAESDGPTPAPLLVAGAWGNGRVLAFAGDTTWHWPMEDFGDPHRRFWRQLVLWLARKDPSTEGSVWVRLDPRRYQPGSRVEFTLGANSPEGNPVKEAAFEVEITQPDGNHRLLRPTRQGDRTVGSFLDTRAAGDYTIRVSAKQEGRLLGNTQVRFLVFKQDLELDNPAADPGLLSSLARITEEFGGEALVPEEFSDLLNRLKKKPLELETEIQTKRNYWDTWPFLLVFVAALGTEWYLRKKWGLV